MSKLNSKNNYNTRIKTSNLQVDGNVGIKTSNPQFALDVSDACRIQTGITTNNLNLTGSLFQNGTTITPSQWTTNTNGSIYYTGGNVSIGTTDQTYTLSVVGPTNYRTTYNLSNISYNYQYLNKINARSFSILNGLSVANDNGVNVAGYGSGTSVAFYATDGLAISNTFGTNGNSFGYVAKYNSSGSFVWASSLQSPEFAEITGLSTSIADDGIYFSGYYSSAGTIYATNGSSVLQTLPDRLGNYSGILGKYSSRGSLLWTSRFGTEGGSFIDGVSYSNDQGVYFGGGYDTTRITIYATNGTTLLQTLGSLGFGARACFIGKYGSTGSLQWTSRIVGSQTNTVNTISHAANDGGAYVGISYQASQLSIYATNGSSIVSTYNNTTSNEGLVVKYNSSGSFLWGSHITGNVGVKSVSLSHDNGVFFGLQVSNSQVGIYATNGTTLTTFGNSTNNSFVGKYNSSGSLLWINLLGGAAGQRTINSVYGTTDGGVLVGAEYSSSQVNFYATNGTTVVTTLGNINTSQVGLLAKYDSIGSLLWVSTIDGTSTESIDQITMAQDGLYAGGSSSSTTVNIYDVTGQIVATSGNGITGFITKYTTSTSGPFRSKSYNMQFNTSGTLSVSGDASVSGSMTVVGTKNFVIPHPDPSKSEYNLRHSLLEGPTRGENVYRYEISTKNKQGAISLPDYFSFLNENVDVYISAVDILGYGTGTYDKESNSVRVLVSDDGIYNVLVIGTRCDTGARSFDELGVEYII